MHARKQIRDSVVTLLSSGTNWQHVNPSRVPPISGQFPFVSVYFESESSDSISVHPTPTLERSANLVIEGVALMNMRDTATMEDSLESIAEEVEQLLTTDTIGKETHLSGTEFEILYDQNEAPSAGTVRVTFTVSYYTVSGIPETLT